MPFTTLRSYAELMRVANVFTSVSNVWMGMILTTGYLPGWSAVGISLASALMYLAGMVLNDVFDHQIDAVERPGRPIPSGRVSLTSAKILGWGLLVAGLIAAGLVTFYVQSYLPIAMAICLSLAIIGYDAGLKQTWLGPFAMGMCRVFNVLLGMSLVGLPTEWRLPEIASLNLLPAFAIGLYIIGVTWFARDEAGEGKRRTLVMGSLTVLAAMVLLATMPWSDAPAVHGFRIDSTGWFILWFVVAGTILRRMVVAILQPTPRNMQRAVGNAILSLITIDAAISLGYADPYWACAVLALVAPAMQLSQMFKMT
ncbi:UbiA family prenyltransferase [Aeoliella mucimassa]|uniref:Prenyltransferase n=1 Tax=Aeoliella mucimassa TaxID=2527972 RepID=A0A518ANV9_9BACT|nr:UbiA family prenyltransferase [Aeoliella mucimassa]QDU56413.1 prenyltransferase [Aeoliella mucimassa]